MASVFPKNFLDLTAQHTLVCPATNYFEENLISFSFVFQSCQPKALFEFAEELAVPLQSLIQAELAKEFCTVNVCLVKYLGLANEEVDLDIHRMITVLNKHQRKRSSPVERQFSSLHIPFVKLFKKVIIC